MQSTTQNIEDKNIEQMPGAVPITRVQWPIFLKLFVAFFALSLFTLLATGTIIYYALKDFIHMLPSTEIVKLAQSIQSQYIFIIIFVIIPSLIISVFTAQNIASPVKKISKSIKEIAAGNLKVEIKSNRRDELGNLITLFNSMVLRLREIEDRNKEIAQVKSKFITVASHQLRTPSSGVGWGLQALLSEAKGSINDDQRKIILECQTRNLEMIQTVNNLLGVAQIEEGNFAYEFQEVEIGPLAEKLVAEFATEAAMKKLSVKFTNNLESHMKIIADPNRISMALGSILENALQYSAKDTAVQVDLEQGHTYILFQISNYGIGFKEQDRGKLFTRFFRGDNAVKVKNSGIGLSLTICKKIIDYHQGKIDADSEEATAGGKPVKTTFKIYLPIHRNLIAKTPKIDTFLEGI